MHLVELEQLVLAIALIVIAGVAAVRVSSRSGMPGLLLFLGIGLLLGESGIGITFDNAGLTHDVGIVLLALLLIDGGYTTRWDSIKPVISRSALLATVGVLVSVVVAGGIAYLALPIDPRTAVLLAAMVSSTDAAAVFSILRRLPIKQRVRTTLEAESGFNDPPAIVLVAVVVSDAWSQGSVVGMIGSGLYQLAIGALVGLVIGRIGQFVLQRISLPSSGLYPLATVAIGLLAFSLTGMIDGSGLLAAYVAAVWLGNATLPHHATTASFTESLGWLTQIVLFVMLGLLASPSELPGAVVPAIIIGSALTFVARPLSVLVCLSPFKVGIREQVFISWAGLRGAVPIVLATIPLTVGYPDARHIFHVTFLLVVTFTLIQGPLLPRVATWMRVTEVLQPYELNFDSAPLEGVKASVVQFEVPTASKLIGLHVDELRLPHGAVLSMIIRDDEVLVPVGQMRLRPGDKLLLAVRSSLIERTQSRLAALSRDGRLARWKLSPERWRELYGPKDDD